MVKVWILVLAIQPSPTDDFRTEVIDMPQVSNTSEYCEQLKIFKDHENQHALKYKSRCVAVNLLVDAIKDSTE